MNSELGRDSFDASESEFVLPADPLEQFHLRSALHPGLLPHQQDAPVNGGWANLQHRSGPFHSIEISGAVRGPAPPLADTCRSCCGSRLAHAPPAARSGPRATPCAVSRAPVPFAASSPLRPACTARRSLAGC